MKNANSDDAVSDIGMDNQTPTVPKIGGNIINIGIKNITCRVKERSIDCPTLPMDWKKLDTTMPIPAIGKAIDE